MTTKLFTACKHGDDARPDGKGCHGRYLSSDGERRCICVCHQADQWRQGAEAVAATPVDWGTR